MNDIETAAGGLFGAPLSATSVYPYFLISALLLLAAEAICRKVGFYRTLIAADGRSTRFHAIDGLRGYLALGVYFHHAVISYHYHQTGRWESPPSTFYALCGEVGVALFFMITAFLFWSKGVGSRAPLPVQPFLWFRITRLAPMFFFSVVCVFLVAAIATGFHRNDTLRDLGRQFFYWSSFGFNGSPPINRLEDSWTINSVYWTLPYEWLFYLFLPLGLLAARGPGFWLLAAVSAVAIHWSSSRAIEWNFLFGAIAAVCAAQTASDAPGRLRWTSGIVSVALVALLALLALRIGHGYGWRQSLLLFPVFFCIVKGNSLFGLLTCRAARFLGAISYSIYLLHSIVLYLGLWIAARVVPLQGLSPGVFWLLVAGIGLAVVAASAVTYRVVEHPLLKAAMPAWLRR